MCLKQLSLYVKLLSLTSQLESPCAKRQGLGTSDCWTGAAEGTCEDVGTLSSGHRDWHEPGERLAALLLVNMRRGYFTRKQ